MDQIEEFLAVATVELICDGAARDVGQSYFAPTVAFFEALVEPMPAGRTTECASVITFTDDHFDGWDWYEAGTVLTDTVTISAVPRGHFMKSNP